MEYEKHLVWAVLIGCSIFIVCLTLMELSKNPYEIKFSIEMDNNSLEAYKTAVLQSETTNLKDYNHSDAFLNNSKYKDLVDIS